MSSLILLCAVGLYLLLGATCGSLTFIRGHKALAICGVVLPVLWVVGASLPAKASSGSSGYSRSAPRADNLVGTRPRNDKWEDAGLDWHRERGTSGRAAEGFPVSLADGAPHAAGWPADPTGLEPPIADERVRRRLEFLRWLTRTGRLVP